MQNSPALSRGVGIYFSFRWRISQMISKMVVIVISVYRLYVSIFCIGINFKFSLFAICTLNVHPNFSAIFSNIFILSPPFSILSFLRWFFNEKIFYCCLCGVMRFCCINFSNICRRSRSVNWQWIYCYWYTSLCPLLRRGRFRECSFCDSCSAYFTGSRARLFECL